MLGIDPNTNFVYSLRQDADLVPYHLLFLYSDIEKFFEPFRKIQTHMFINAPR